MPFTSFHEKLSGRSDGLIYVIGRGVVYESGIGSVSDCMILIERKHFSMRKEGTTMYTYWCR
jgi:hypothetical protein